MPSKNILIIVLIIALVVIGILWNRNEQFVSCGLLTGAIPCDMQNKDCKWTDDLCKSRCIGYNKRECIKDNYHNNKCKWSDGFLGIGASCIENNE